MASDETRDETKLKDAGRRSLLKAATVAGGTVAASALLPASWRKPLATVGGLPAHAQTSAGIDIYDERARSRISGTDAGLLNGAYIDCECRYKDYSGEFNHDHSVTFEVYEGIFPNTSAQLAKNANGCGLAVTYALSEIQHLIGGPPPTTHEGYLKFTVNSSCFPPGHIAWYLHKGNMHKSNWVNASIELQIEVD